MLTTTLLDAILARLPGLTIGLVGDLFLDRYLELQSGATELSIETGLEAYQIARVRNSPGALGTVVNNLAALGVGMLVPVTVIGDDGHAYDLLRELRRLPVDPTHVLCTGERLTPTYTKPLRQAPGGAWHELNRLDVRTRGPLGDALAAELADRVRQVFHSSDGLIVLDQINEAGWGVVDQRLRTVLAELQQQVPEKLIYVDSRRHLSEFALGILKCNRCELLGAVGETATDDATLARAASELSARTGRPVFCTLGEAGILVARPGERPSIARAYHVTGPVDIVGAGDAATSGIVAALLAEADDHSAAAVGNLVASITVQQLGTTGVASPAQVRDRWRQVVASRDR